MPPATTARLALRLVGGALLVSGLAHCDRRDAPTTASTGARSVEGVGAGRVVASPEAPAPAQRAEREAQGTPALPPEPSPTPTAAPGEAAAARPRRVQNGVQNGAQSAAQGTTARVPSYTDFGTLGPTGGGARGNGYHGGLGTGTNVRPPPGGLGGLGGGVNVPTTGFNPQLGAAPLPTIDPNGRFATTYRPGRGSLAWFEAAVARGEMPGGARALVGDLGARYAPDMAAPAGHALDWRADLAREALPPAGGHTHLRIALRSTATAATERPPLSVHVVLDVSGSMDGEPIVRAREAAAALVQRLEPGDHFSLTVFGSDAAVVVREGAVGPRRAAIAQTIAGVGLRGGTNIAAGMELGYQEARRGPQGPEWVKLVMLLSDGRPNAGETRAEALGAMAANAFQTGVQTSAFGLGQDYDGALMSTIAERGAGGYYYLRDGAAITPALGAELDSRLQPVAQAVEVRVRFRPDVRLTQTYGSRRLNAEESAAVRAQEVAVDTHVARRDRIAANRQNDVEGGMRFFIPGFSRDDQHVILLGIDLPAGTGTRPIATVELRYKDRITRQNVTAEAPVRVRYADSDAASAATANPSVQRTVQGFDAGEAMMEASRRVERGDTAGASAVLAERAQLLRAAAAALREPRLAEDAARLDRFRNLVGASGELSQPLVLAMLLNTTAQGMLH